MTADEYKDTKASFFQGFRSIHEMIDSGVSWSGHERNAAFLNTGARKGATAQFADVSSVIGFDFADDARGIAAIDWNFDGALDFFVTNRTGPRLRFLLNTLAPSDRFLLLKLVGTTCNRDAIGARAQVTLTKNGQPASLMRTVYAGHGFISQSSKWLHFGLDAGASLEEVAVKWPDGAREVFRGVVPGGHFVLVQGKGEAQRFTPPAARVPLVRSANPEGESGDTAAICLEDPIPVPPLKYSLLDGRNRSLRPPLDRPTLINLWAPWCAPCISELAEMTAQEDAIRAAGLEIVALNVDVLKKSDDETIEKGRAALNRLRFPFTSGLPDKELMQILELAHNSTFLRPQQLPVPCSMLLDRSGRIAAVYRGRVPVERLLKDVAALTAKDPQVWSNHVQSFGGQWIKARERVPYLHMVTTLLNQNAIVAAADFLTLHREVLQSEALYPQTLMVCGTALLQLDQTDRGAEMLLRSLELNPSLAEAHNNLGIALRRDRDLAGARDRFLKALELKPNYVDALINLSLCESDNRRLKKALEYINAALAIQDDHSTALLLAGTLNIQLEQWVDAKPPLERLVKLHPDHVDALINLGGVSAKLGEFKKAIRHYEHALKLRPNMPGVQQTLEAVRRLEKASN